MKIERVLMTLGLTMAVATATATQEPQPAEQPAAGTLAIPEALPDAHSSPIHQVIRSVDRPKIGLATSELKVPATRVSGVWRLSRRGEGLYTVRVRTLEILTAFPSPLRGEGKAEGFLFQRRLAKRETPN